MCALRGSRHGCWVHAEEQCPRGTISVGAAWGGGPVVGPLSPGGKERVVINLSLGPTAQAGGDREWAPEDERREAGQGGGGFSLGKKQGGCPQAGAGCAGRGSQTRHLASQGGGQGWVPIAQVPSPWPAGPATRCSGRDSMQRSVAGSVNRSMPPGPGCRLMRARWGHTSPVGRHFRL